MVGELRFYMPSSGAKKKKKKKFKWRMSASQGTQVSPRSWKCKWILPWRFQKECSPANPF